MISCPFHIPILKFAPVLSQKLEEIHLVMFGAHFLQLYRKKKVRWPHFLFHDLNNNSASFQRDKIKLA